MRVFVTGATGFIGSFLAEALISQGHEVTCLLRQTSSTQYLPASRVNIIYGALEDSEGLREAVRGSQIVFHLAGITRAFSADEFRRVNAQGTLALLRACRAEVRELERFVLVSSLAAAGPACNKSAVVESDEPQPISDYGRSKLDAERHVLQFRKSFPFTIIRPPIVYGPRDTDVYSYIKQIALGLAPQLGMGKRQFSIVHVHDLVQGIIQAATQPAGENEIFYLCNRQPVMWADLGVTIARCLNKQPLTLHIPEFMALGIAALGEAWARITRSPALFGFDKMREACAERWVCSGEKAKKMLGFEPQLPLAMGMASTIRWYQDAGWL